jgi:hypothetical protein
MTIWLHMPTMSLLNLLPIIWGKHGGRGFEMVSNTSTTKPFRWHLLCSCLLFLYISAHVGTRCSTIFCFLFEARNGVAHCAPCWCFCIPISLSRHYDEYYDMSVGVFWICGFEVFTTMQRLFSSVNDWPLNSFLMAGSCFDSNGGLAGSIDWS